MSNRPELQPTVSAASTLTPWLTGWPSCFSLHVPIVWVVELKAVNETFVFFLHNRALELQYLVYTFVCLWCRIIRTRCFDSHVSRHLDPYTFCWWLCLPAVHIACWSHKCNVFKMLLPDIAFMQLIKWRQQSQDTTWGQTLCKWEWNKPGFFMLGS